MTLGSVYVGTAPGNPIYVQGTEYDAAGRATLRTLGSGVNAVQTRYNYYQWNASINGGKLQQIYTTRGTTPLQNFQYAYDSNANITTIHDYIVGSPQTQTFGYDNLDRLTSAGASGGTQGNYTPEGYTYDATTGNLATKAGSSYNYGAQSAGCVDGALDKAHAAVSAGGNNYCYDKNGNMVRRVIGGVTYTLTYDAENHMTGYSGGSVNVGFVYDGDGRRVQSTVNGVTTQFVGSHVEWKTSTTDMVRYYYAGGVRVAMRTGDAGLVWLVGDHLGSTSIAVTDSSGATERQGYKAWGEFRFGSLPTKYQFTGQRNEPEIGLYYYGARWYDSSLGRFAQADTIIPDPYNSLDYDRYQYVRSNPLKNIDPSGHFTCGGKGITQQECQDIIENWLMLLASRGGKVGARLANFFRNMDSRVVCHENGTFCITLTDQIHILIVPTLGESVAMQTNVMTNTISIARGTLDYANESEERLLVVVCEFGHEIRHLEQGPLFHPSLHSEVDAYDIQFQIYEAMGIENSGETPVRTAAYVHGLVGVSDYELLRSDLARAYPNYPLYKLVRWANGPIVWFVNAWHDFWAQ